ncbi:hypothetical protein DFH09DRAFT_1468384 [Mycena vulgaris]|nr:hypothetical protein DFH09DRAFT_1468384 [Mycena vulgaris]
MFEDIPMFSISTPDLTDPTLSAFPTEHDPRAPVVRMQSLDVVAVASHPPSPTKRRGFPIPQLRTLVKKLKPKSTRHRPAGPFAIAPRLSSPPRRAATTARGKRLTIRDGAFFLPIAHAENGFDDAENGFDAAHEDVKDDAAGTSGFRAPPPTPCDPFRTPPTTPIRAALSAIENSPAQRRALKHKKIVQVFGPEAREAARQHVAEGEREAMATSGQWQRL